MKDETKIPEISEQALTVLTEGILWAESELQPTFEKMLNEGQKITHKTYAAMVAGYLLQQCEEHEKEKGDE